MYTLLDFFFSLLIGLLIFVSIQGYLGNTLKKIANYIFSSKNIRYLMLFIVVTIIIWYYYKLNMNIVYCIDEGTEKRLLEVSSNNITINNPKINVPDSVAKGMINIGAGTAIAKGMSAAATVVKSTSLPPTVKLGVIIGGGIAGGSMLIGFNSIYNALNTKVSNSSTNNDMYNSRSILETNENINTAIDNVITFLNANFVLHVVMLYLMLILIILFICDFIINKKTELLFVKDILGIKIYDLIFKLIRYTANINSIWIFITIIILIICTTSSVIFANIILVNIDTISNIISSKK